MGEGHHVSHGAEDVQNAAIEPLTRLLKGRQRVAGHTKKGVWGLEWARRETQ